MAPVKQPDRQTGSASRSFLRYVEEHGIILRQRAGVGSNERLDPFATAQKFGIIVFNYQDLQRLDPDDIQRLKEINARTWSGGAQQLPDGRLLIVLNPNQTPERAAITVMEEVAHAYFDHRPSLLETKSIGLIGRTYNDVDEEEAYWTGAAALLPSSVVAKAVWNATPADVLASTYGVSLELVEFRIKTLGLWSWYSRHRTAA